MTHRRRNYHGSCVTPTSTTLSHSSKESQWMALAGHGDEAQAVLAEGYFLWALVIVVNSCTRYLGAIQVR